MKRASYKKDFQSWKGINGSKTALLQYSCRPFLIGRNTVRHSLIAVRKFCVVPLHCSYGQIGYTVHFPYSDIPEVEYDWEMNKFNYRQRELGKLFNVSIIQNIASCPLLKNIHQWRASFKNSMLLW